MGYLLGTDSEELTFGERGSHVQAVGHAHAVDPTSPLNPTGGVLAYALCGKPVRAWPDQEFDPEAPHVHEECATRAQAEG